MKNKIITLFIALVMAASMSINDASATEYQTIDTRVGELTFENSFEHGIPTQDTSKKLFDAIDFQRACQAYIWANPLMGFYEWMFEDDAKGAERGQIIYYGSYDSKLGGLTFNTSTPYAVTFFDLRKEPVMIEIPNVPVRGATHDMWQIEIAQMTKPGKYVFYAPGQGEPKNLPAGAEAFQSDTNHVFLGLRLMDKTHEKRMADMKKIKITNLKGSLISKRKPLFVKKGTDLAQKRGMAYWESLHKAINMEVVHERDRIMMDMLAPLGIEKGKPFNPDARQRAILKEAVIVGEAMTKNIDFNKTGRLPQSEYGPEGNTWEIATASTPGQDRGYGMDLDGRAAWFYEAVTNDIAMHGMVNGGWGQVYLDNYRADDGNGLDGTNHYTLTIPPNADYAETFWTVTVYNVENRAPVTNKQGRADVGSDIPGTVKNKDGSITFHFSPDKPKGVSEANWVQTNKGQNWFVYFRAYSPSKAFVNQEEHSIVPNFQIVK